MFIFVFMSFCSFFSKSCVHIVGVRMCRVNDAEMDGYLNKKDNLHVCRLWLCDKQEKMTERKWNKTLLCLVTPVFQADVNTKCCNLMFFWENGKND